MFDKNIWVTWWNKLQQDAADCLQEQIFNLATLIGAVMIYVKLFKPQYYEAVASFANGYLLVAKSAK